MKQVTKFYSPNYSVLERVEAKHYSRVNCPK